MIRLKSRWYYRFALGRQLIHLGLWVMPGGKVKRELWTLIDQWATKVHYAVEEAERNGKMV
jgi:hypothetical protein